MALDALPGITDTAIGWASSQARASAISSRTRPFPSCVAPRLLGDEGALVWAPTSRRSWPAPCRHNDAAGVTAPSRSNLLRRMNRELHATFDLKGFAHEHLQSVEGRIEIYFRSLRDQSGSWPALLVFATASGSTPNIPTNTICGLAGDGADGGFRTNRTWTDPDRLFAVSYLKAV